MIFNYQLWWLWLNVNSIKHHCHWHFKPNVTHAMGSNLLGDLQRGGVRFSVNNNLYFSHTQLSYGFRRLGLQHISCVDYFFFFLIDLCVFVFWSPFIFIKRKRTARIYVKKNPLLCSREDRKPCGFVITWETSCIYIMTYITNLLLLKFSKPKMSNKPIESRMCLGSSGGGL